MSEIKFACIHCGQKLSCEQTLTGQRITCPACQRSVIVPWAPIESHAAKKSASSTESRAIESVRTPSEIPKISIPELSVPEIESSSSRASPKVLQLAGRNRPAPGFSKLAVVSFAFSFLGPAGFFPAIVCGHIAKWQMRRNSALRGDSLATAGLAIAYTCGLLTAVFIARSLLRQP